MTRQLCVRCYEVHKLLPLDAGLYTKARPPFSCAHYFRPELLRLGQKSVDSLTSPLLGFSHWPWERHQTMVIWQSIQTHRFTWSLSMLLNHAHSVALKSLRLTSLYCSPGRWRSWMDLWWRTMPWKCPTSQMRRLPQRVPQRVAGEALMPVDPLDPGLQVWAPGPRCSRTSHCESWSPHSLSGQLSAKRVPLFETSPNRPTQSMYTELRNYQWTVSLSFLCCDQKHHGQMQFIKKNK